MITKNKIVALIPAHNEEGFIGDTVLSLKAQTLPIHRIVVVSDNSVDDTELEAKEAGAEVIATEGNTGRKAGALNYGLHLILPELNDDDYIFIQDADTVLVPNFMALAVGLAQKDPMTVVCGRYAANPSRNPLVVLQRNEFARDGRMTERRDEKTHVLVGTSSLFPVRVLRHLQRARQDGTAFGRRAPKPDGFTNFIYVEDSITEDFELTLALKTLGYRTMSPTGAEAITDAMDTFSKLWNQRMRWARGGIEDLRNYGWTKITKGFHWRRSYVTFGILSMLLFTSTITATLATSGYVVTTLPWTILTGIFVIDRVIQVRRAGMLSMVYAALLIPEIAYNFFHQVVYVAAYVKSFSRTSAVWHET